MHEWPREVDNARLASEVIEPTPIEEYQAVPEQAVSGTEPGKEQRAVWTWKPHPENRNILVADNVEMPLWYREGRYEESERRRPAVESVSTSQGIKYKAVWCLDVGIQDPLIYPHAPFDTVADAQDHMQKEWNDLMNSVSAEDFQDKIGDGRP